MISFSALRIEFNRVALSFLFGLMTFGLLGAPSVFAVASSVLPTNSGEYFGCDTNNESDMELFEAFMRERSVIESVGEGDSDTQAMMNDFLACAVKLGQIKFWMIPYFVNYALEFLITVAGVLVVLMIIVEDTITFMGPLRKTRKRVKPLLLMLLEATSLFFPPGSL